MVPPPPRRHAILVAYTAAVLALTLLPLPGVATDLFPSWSDKAVHVVMFAALAGLRYWDRLPAGRPGPAGVVGPAVALAGLIELAQGPLPGRTGDVWDFVLGCVGAAVGYGVARLVRLE